MPHNNLYPQMPIPEFLKHSYPETPEGVRAFFDDMVAHLGMGFNPDTDGEDYILDGKPVFTSEQAIFIDEVMINCREICSCAGVDIYSLALAAITQKK